MAYSINYRKKIAFYKQTQDGLNMEQENSSIAMYGKLKDKYIDPFTDFGFKKLFGEECNKDLLLDFLNELLHKEEGKIVSITYLKNEMLGVSAEARKAVFDIHCENERGEKFIVEIQKTKQTFFKDRTLYYSTFPITRQAIPGDWSFELIRNFYTFRSLPDKIIL
jgi:predicted transposase/invertase (TIGR01784 family)